VAKLCLVAGYSVAEAAVRLELPPVVVKGRLQRARQHLRKELSEMKPKARATAPATAQTERPVVLVVDDELHIVRLIQVNLERAGYDVMVATDGLEALERLGERTPDLITLDLLMPRRDGWDVLKDIRSRGDTLLIPVIVVSAVPVADPRNALCCELADAYIQKPFSPVGLISMIDRRLAHLTVAQQQDVLEWRRARFGEGLTPELAAAHLASTHYLGIHKEAYGVLAEMGAAAIPALAEVAAGEDAMGWRSALQLLGQRKEEEATAALAKLFGHDDRARRWEALAAMGTLTADGALQALVGHGQAVFDELSAALKGTDERLQSEAIRALQRIRTPDALRLLQDITKRFDGPVAEQAAWGLRSMGRG
jgi:two-component system, OmpR family, alkaline phosphatase synthesis response regulator PhoP